MLRMVVVGEWGPRVSAAAIIVLVAGLVPPSRAECESPDGAPRVGIRLTERDGGLFIDMVVPGLPAAAAGVEIGDELLDVDGFPVVDRAHAAELLARFATQAGVVLRLRPPVRVHRLEVASAPGVETSRSTTAAPRPYLGLSLAQRSRELHVDRVAVGSPVAASGIQIGDALLSFDGIDASSESAVRSWVDGLIPGALVRLDMRGPARSASLSRFKTATPKQASAPNARGRRNLRIGQSGIGLYGGVAAAGNRTAIAATVGGRLRGLAGTFPGVEGGGAAAFDVGVELTAGFVHANRAAGGLLGAQLEVGFFVGGFQAATSDSQMGAGLRVNAVAVAGAILAEAGGGEFIGLGVQAGLEVASFDRERGRLTSFIVYVMVTLTTQDPQAQITDVTANAPAPFGPTGIVVNGKTLTIDARPRRGWRSAVATCSGSSR